MEMIPDSFYRTFVTPAPIWFPTIVVDNFWDNPNWVREYALSQKFDVAGKYPGMRTKNLDELNPQLFEKFVKKVYGIYYDLESIERDGIDLSIRIETSFQLIPPYTGDPNDAKDQGWIHMDHSAIFAGIIYLNPSNPFECGTSIYKPIDESKLDWSQQERLDFWMGGKEDNYYQAFENNNSNFIETINVSNVYNRLISFDAYSYHGAQNFVTHDEPRLTQVFFVYDSTIESPLDRMKTNKIILEK
jgi:hypothetical protein